MSCHRKISSESDRKMLGASDICACTAATTAWGTWDPEVPSGRVPTKSGPSLGRPDAFVS